MSRRISPALLAELKKTEEQRIVMLSFLDFGPDNDDAAFLHTDVGDITWNPYLPSPFTGNRTFTGVGLMGGVFPIKENPSDRPDTYSLELSGVNEEIISHVRNPAHRGRAAKVWIGAFNDLTGDFIPGPELISGEMDVISITEENDAVTVSVLLIDERSKLSRGKGVYFSHTQQQERNPGDLFCFGAARLQEKQVQWGKQDKPAGSGTGVGGGGRSNSRGSYHHR